MGHVVRVATILHSITGMPEDDVQWSVYFRKTSGDVTMGEADDLTGWVSACLADAVGVANNLDSYIADQISRVNHPTIKCYPVEGGSPLNVGTSLGLGPSNGSGGLPSEVAVCLSFAADLTDVAEEAPDDGDPDSAPERPASRRRGRIYFGPLVPGAATDSPPVRNSEVGAGLLDYAERLGNVNSVPGLDDFEWCVYSQTDGLARPVVRAWVDNAFDIQRRRGERATSRMETTI